MPKGLNPKQAAFVREYLIDHNGTQAAIRAGYSEKTAHAIANENLRKPEIADAIKKGSDKAAQKAEITAAEVLKRFDRLAGKAENAEKFSDALKANELIAKHLGMFVEKSENKSDVTIKVEYDDEGE